MKIHIEFCIKWNYGPEFDRVSKMIKKISSNSKISSNRDYPRSGSFEIEVDGKIVYSKLKTYRFPTEEDINKLIK